MEDDLSDEVLRGLFGEDGVAEDGLVDLWRIGIPFDPAPDRAVPGDAPRTCAGGSGSLSRRARSTCRTVAWC
jgi:hypothetical protein